MLKDIKPQLQQIKSNLEEIKLRSEIGNLTPSEIVTYTESIQRCAEFIIRMCSTIDEAIPNGHGYGICEICGKRVVVSELKIGEDKYHCKECYHDLLARYGM